MKLCHIQHGHRQLGSYKWTVDVYELLYVLQLEVPHMHTSKQDGNFFIATGCSENPLCFHGACKPSFRSQTLGGVWNPCVAPLGPSQTWANYVMIIYAINNHADSP